MKEMMNTNCYSKLEFLTLCCLTIHSVVSDPLLFSFFFFLFSFFLLLFFLFSSSLFDQIVYDVCTKGSSAVF